MSLQKQNYDYLIEPDGNYPFVEPGGGTKGTKGNSGTDGAKGQKGQRGQATNGTDGLKGQKGQKGRPGIAVKGQKGDTQSTVFDFQGAVATVADLPATGNTEGDVYQITTTQALYVWDGTTWLLLAANASVVKGEKGEKGQKGTAGTDGDKGQKGQAGTDGTDGIDGTKGAKGQKGDTAPLDDYLTITEANASYVQYNKNGTSNSQEISGKLTLAQPNATGTLTVQRSPTTAQATASLLVQGGIATKIGGTQDLLKSYNYALKVDGTAQTQSDYIRYFGRTDTTDSLQTQLSCDDRYVRKTASQTISGTKTFSKNTIFNEGITSKLTSTFYNPNGTGNAAAIQINGPDGTTKTGEWDSNGFIECVGLKSSEESYFYNQNGSGGAAIVITQMDGTTERGRWSSNGNIQVDGGTSKGQFKFYNTAGNNRAAFEIRDSTGASIPGGVAWFSSGNLQAGAFSQTANLTQASIFYKITGKDNWTLDSGKKLTINRGTEESSTGGLVINGMTTAGVNASILDCFYNSGTVGDAVNYHGLTSNSNNLQNKASVDAAIAAALNPDWVTLTLASGVSGSAKYRIIGGSIVQLVFTVNKTGADVAPGQLLFTMPSAARPSQATNFVGNPKGAGTSTGQGSFVMIGVTSNDGQVKVMSNDYQLTGPALTTTSTINNLIPASSSGNNGPQDIHGAVMWALT